MVIYNETHNGEQIRPYRSSGRQRKPDRKTVYRHHLCQIVHVILPVSKNGNPSQPNSSAAENQFVNYYHEHPHGCKII